jgi:hypothetical protein
MKSINFAFVACLVTVGALVFMACPASPSNPGSSDTTLPTFGGIASATAVGMTGAAISWGEASDDQTAASDMIYDVWDASASNVPTTGTPAYVTQPGVTSLTVAGLPANEATYFAVRAVDAAGNMDANTVVKSVTPTAGSWGFVDGGQATGINSGPSVDSPASAVVNGTLYALWTETDGTGNWFVRASVYNGNDSSPSWTSIDNGPTSGINHDPSGSPSLTFNSGKKETSLVAFNNKLYASWSEANPSGDYQIRVAVYDPANAGAGWKFVDGDGTAGINYDPTAQTTSSFASPNLVVAGSTLYDVWLEPDTQTSPEYWVRAAAYNGTDSSPSWTFIDGNSTTPVINYASTADYLDAAAYNEKLFAAWTEGNLIRVKAYSGGSWVSVDGGGLNYDSTKTTSSPAMVEAGGNLYAAWIENNASAVPQTRVAEFNGSLTSPSWSFVDGNGANGINLDPTSGDYMPALAELNGGLIAAFIEKNGSAYQQVRARAFNGDASNSSWAWVDGGQSNGLNYDPNYSALLPAPVEFNGKLYIAWVENSGVASTQTRVIRGK